MHYMIIAIMMAVIAVIGMMLQRVFQGPTVYDRMNGLGVTGTDTILLIILFGYLDGRPEMYVDIAPFLCYFRLCRFGDHSEISGR